MGRYRTIAGQQHVAGIDVSMEDAASVHEANSLCDVKGGQQHAAQHVHGAAAAASQRVEGVGKRARYCAYIYQVVPQRPWTP